MTESTLFRSMTWRTPPLALETVLALFVAACLYAASGNGYCDLEGPVLV
jgi:hypothetical protein